MKKVLLTIIFILVLGNFPSYVYARDLGKREVPGNRECYEAITKGTLHEEWAYPSSGNSTYALSYYLYDGSVYFIAFAKQGFGGKGLEMICQKWNLS